MSDTRMPKQIFCGQLLQLAKMKQLQEVGTHKHYKDGLKQNLKACGIPPTELNNATAARGSWQTRIVLTRLTTSRPHVLAPSRPSDKLASQLPIIQNTAGQWACDRCDRVCDSRIGLYAHRKAHRDEERDPSSTTAHSIYMRVAWRAAKGRLVGAYGSTPMIAPTPQHTRAARRRS